MKPFTNELKEFEIEEATSTHDGDMYYEIYAMRPPEIGPPNVWLTQASYTLAELFSFVCVFEVPKGKTKNLLACFHEAI